MRRAVFLKEIARWAACLMFMSWSNEEAEKTSLTKRNPFFTTSLLLNKIEKSSTIPWISYQLLAPLGGLYLLLP